MGASLSITGLARRNIQRRPWRSFCLVLTVLLFSFFLFAGSVFSTGLSRGAASAANRLGADIMVVPEGYDPHIDSILLSGKPSTFYLPPDIMTKLGDLAEDTGIAQMSPQTFLATLRASCCSYPVQLVGIDYETDFIVRPWLEATLHRTPGDGEVIVGHHVTGSPGDSLMFFGQSLRIAGRLEQTGMGFDSTVFMNRPTIMALAKEAERIRGRPAAGDAGSASIVMVKLRPGYDSVAAAREINRRLNPEGVYALFSKKFVNSIGRSLVWLSWLIHGGLFFVWGLAVVVIGLLFAVTLAERRKEMGVLRALGATRGRLARLVLTEAFLISLYGAILGVCLGAAVIAALSPTAAEALRLPFLMPSWSGLAMPALAAVAAAVLTGMTAAGWAALSAGRQDIYENLRAA